MPLAAVPLLALPSVPIQASPAAPLCGFLHKTACDIVSTRTDPITLIITTTLAHLCIRPPFSQGACHLHSPAYPVPSVGAGRCVHPSHTNTHTPTCTALGPCPHSTSHSSTQTHQPQQSTHTHAHLDGTCIPPPSCLTLCIEHCILCIVDIHPLAQVCIGTLKHIFW